VKVVAQGTGQALDTARRGDADVVFVHAKSAEETFLAVLSDRGTWLSFKNKANLLVVVEGDKRLFNQYGVMLVKPEKHHTVKKELGQHFIDWLISPEGQKATADYKIDGQQLFYPNANDPNA
jgi:tungstate transport system substrate-binding protein